MRTAGDALARALTARGGQVLFAREWPWASATFIGARHRLEMAMTVAGFCEGIEEDEFDLGEHLLADIVVMDREWAGEVPTVVLEALTIEDWRDPAEAGAQAAEGIEAPTLTPASERGREGSRRNR